MRGMTTSLILAVAATTFAGCEKYELDRQMEELCKKDGGVQVYETVQLPASRFDSTGRLFTSPAEDKGGGLFVRMVTQDYRIESRTDVIKSGEPFGKRVISDGRLLRFRTTVRRVADQRLLGEETSYSRTGGDITLGQPSQNYCPNPRPIPDVIQTVFLKGE